MQALTSSQRTMLGFTLFKELNEAYQRYTSSELLGIINKNSEYGDNGNQYIYQGNIFGKAAGDKTYITSMKYAPRGFPVSPLHPSLVQRHEEWQENVDIYENEKARIQQILSGLILKANTAQQVRDMFPDHVVAMLQKEGPLLGLERSSPSLDPGPKDSPEYEAILQNLSNYWDRSDILAYGKISSKIDQYLGYRFLS